VRNYYSESRTRVQGMGMGATKLSTFLRRLTRGMAAETVRDQSDQQLVEQLLGGRDEAVFGTVSQRGF
jgi:hypothetical protein